LFFFCDDEFQALTQAISAAVLSALCPSWA
jgi:hypothetical protein